MGRPKTTDRPFMIRAKERLLTALAELAAIRGVPSAEVARRAIEIHLAESMLCLMDDPEYVAALREGRPDVDVDEFRRETARDVKRLRAEAFAPSRSWHMLAESHRPTNAASR